jgi:hypothetical protein
MDRVMRRSLIRIRLSDGFFPPPGWQLCDGRSSLRATTALHRFDLAFGDPDARKSSARSPPALARKAVRTSLNFLRMLFPGFHRRDVIGLSMIGKRGPKPTCSGVFGAFFAAARRPPLFFPISFAFLTRCIFSKA